jgi:hypothetical protein
MSLSKLPSTVALALLCLAAATVYGGDLTSPRAHTAPGADQAHKLADIRPGVTTKTQVRALLGAPWRIVQFNDCGMAMPGQADETWEYRGRDATGTYRLHVEFGDDNLASLVARIPDRVPGGKGTAARAAPPMVMAHNERM